MVARTMDTVLGEVKPFESLEHRGPAHTRQDLVTPRSSCTSQLFAWIPFRAEQAWNTSGQAGFTVSKGLLSASEHTCSEPRFL